MSKYRIHSAAMEKMQAEAARWRYVRDHMTGSESLNMDGTSWFYFRHPKGRARTIDELIDRKIAELNAKPND